MQKAIPLLAALLLAACSATPGFDSEKETAMTAQPQFSMPAKPIDVAFDVIRHDVRFEGEAVLTPAGIDDLTRTLAGYHLAETDTIRIAPFGGQSQALADRRLTGVSTAIVNLGHVASIGTPLAAADAPAEATGIAVLIGRWAARVPNCPDWSQPAGSTAGNLNTSNFGCSDAINLAAMLEQPQDLLRGRSFSGSSAGLPASAVSLYGSIESATANETQPIVGSFTTLIAGGEDE